MKYQSRQWSKAVYRNVSKHSSIKITAVSQGILSKNFLGISWCLFSEILYSAEFRKNRRHPATRRRWSHLAAALVTRLPGTQTCRPLHCIDCWSSLDTSLKIHLISINDKIVFPPTKLMMYRVDTCFSLRPGRLMAAGGLVAAAGGCIAGILSHIPPADTHHQ